jgi:geranylgeranyl diphosphate synthase type II
MLDVAAYLREFSDEFNQALRAYLPRGGDAVSQAMRYSVEGGGKRIRPALAAAFCELWGGAARQATPLAAALELVHTYSLLHDDLPCMDNDDYRRGQPSCHRKFGEAAALLAGDALLTLAFGVVAEAAAYPFELRCRAAALLARAAGAQGMVGGQWLDLSYENQTVTRPELEEMNRRKTGALLETACAFGCLAGGANEAQTSAALRYADAVGLLFQLTDDILDAVGSREKLGKSPGKDRDRGKNTWVSLLGLARAKEEALRLSSLARREIEPFAPGESLLCRLPGWLAGRES